jgi:hypothetical protein
MLTSIRRTATLSMISMTLALAGCTDPRGRYDDYASMFHTPDAGPMLDSPMTGGLADITGTFLLAITTPIALPPLQTLDTLVLDQTSTPPKVNLHIQYLSDADRTPIAEGQTDYNNLDVDPTTGVFTVNVGDLVIPKAATSIGSITVNGVVITSTIHSADFFCGTLTGNALGTDLTGSTFGAVRVQVGQTGSALPSPALSCADEPTGNGDAGTSTIDAGTSTPDAGTSTPDAGSSTPDAA